MAKWFPWVITSLTIQFQGNTLYVFARTQRVARLFLTWHWTQPEWVPVYRRRRGVDVLCGYVLRWTNPNTVWPYYPYETHDHQFRIYPLGHGIRVAMYLWSALGPPGLPQQSPLFKVIIPTGYTPLQCVLWIGVGIPASTPPIPPVQITATVQFPLT